MRRTIMSRLNSVIFRRDKIIDLCRRKSVLHLGFVQHAHLYRQKIEEGKWLHSQIVDVAEHVVGIDYLETEVKDIQDRFGYEVRFGDVMGLDGIDIEETFDVIVCGELIEHIENPGLMLDGIKRFMHPHSLLIVTTPNPWSSHRMKLIKNGVMEDKWLNPEHVAWYSLQTVRQILERKGYSVQLCDYYYLQERQELLRDTDKGFFGALLLLRRVFNMSRIPDYQYDGLFFVASLR